MPVFIDVEAMTFSDVAQEVFETIKGNAVITRIEIEKNCITFKQDPARARGFQRLSVETDEPMDHLEIIAFLVSPGIWQDGVHVFSSEEWLNKQLDRYRKLLALNIDGPSVTIDQSSK